MLLSSVESGNLGRQFAGSSIRESITVNKKLSASINAGLMKQMQEEKSDIDFLSSNQSGVFNKRSSVKSITKEDNSMQLGGLSQVS